MKNTVINVDGFYKKSSLAIAANQVGYDYNIILLLEPKYRQYFNRLRDAITVINPTYSIVNTHTNIKWEGCLSNTEYISLVLIT